MSDLPHVTQPGPVADARIESFAGAAQSFAFEPEVGLTFVDALTKPTIAMGLAGGTIRLDGLTLDPFRYVIPSLSDGEHVAFYSRTYAPEGGAVIETGSATFGIKDGQPFVHCHAIWTEADGVRRAGHILPHDTIVSRSGNAVATGLPNVAMRQDFDPETRFTLFHPVPVGPVAVEGGDLVLAQIRPNEELFSAIETLCARHGFRQARIVGGVGSIIGARFEDGRVLTNMETEIFVTDGFVAEDDSGRPVARIDVGLVDRTGTIMEGRLARGRNPVLIVFELVLQKIA